MKTDSVGVVFKDDMFGFSVKPTKESDITRAFEKKAKSTAKHKSRKRKSRK